MNCVCVSKKLSAYIDAELTSEEKAAVSAHLEECSGCRDELSRLIDQQNLLNKQSETIKPSPGFRAAFWEKARAYEGSKQKWSFPLLRWLPVPISVSFFLVVFSLFSLVSPALYGGSISETAKNSFIGFSGGSIFGPANFSTFCDRCIDGLCECCQGKQGAQCSCKERK